VRNMLVAVLAILILAISLAFSIPSAAAEECHFVLGFKALHDAIPDMVGNCTGAEHYNLVNGDSLQTTTAWHGKGGLLVWRKSDNWTAFTDGSNAWVSGPFGIRKRGNDERFPWEIINPAQTAFANPEVCATIPGRTVITDPLGPLSSACGSLYGGALGAALAHHGQLGALDVDRPREMVAIYRVNPVTYRTIITRANGEVWWAEFGRPLGATLDGLDGQLGVVVSPNGTFLSPGSGINVGHSDHLFAIVNRSGLLMP
jgi:hypothetical protein